MSKKNEEIKNEILKAVKKSYHSVEESYQVYQNNPYSVEYIHRLRVEMRKMRAIMHFLKPIIKKEDYQTVNDTLRTLGKKLSPIRDLDSLIAETQKVAEEQPDLIENYGLVFGYLNEMRLAQGHMNAKEEEIHSFAKDLEATKEVLKTLELKEGELEENGLKEYMIGRYQKKGKRLNKKYKTLDYHDYEAVHDSRKEAKKVRYAAVGFKSLLPKKQRKPIKQKAKNIQTQLGKITDVHMSIEILNHYKGIVPSSELKEAFQKLIDHRRKSIETQ